MDYAFDNARIQATGRALRITRMVERATAVVVAIGIGAGLAAIYLAST